MDPAVSPAYGVGLRGMGGECVCQYLSRFYEHLMKNRYIQERKQQIDWRFWDLHVGEHNIDARLARAHRRRNCRTRRFHAGRPRPRVLREHEIVERFLGQHLRLGQTRSGRADSRTCHGQFFAARRSHRPPVMERRTMTRSIRQFHLAIPVHDLEQARGFYSHVLGAKGGRRTQNFIDFDFYGHHLVLHQALRGRRPAVQLLPLAVSRRDRAGAAFRHEPDWDAWHELASLIKSRRYEFFDPPHIRMQGMPGEHATLFVVDPSGNALEFAKAFRNHDEVFARVFDPRTSEILGSTHSLQKPRHGSGESSMKPASIDDLLRYWAARQGGKAAVTAWDSSRSLTYAQLDERASRIAAMLKRRGLQAGERVVLGFGQHA